MLEIVPEITLLLFVLHAHGSVLIGRHGDVVQDILPVDVVGIVLQDILESYGRCLVILHLVVKAGIFIGFAVQSSVQLGRHVLAEGAVRAVGILDEVSGDRGKGVARRLLVKFIAERLPEEAVDAEESSIRSKRAEGVRGDEVGKIGDDWAITRSYYTEARKQHLQYTDAVLEGRILTADEIQVSQDGTSASMTKETQEKLHKPILNAFLEMYLK